MEPKDEMTAEQAMNGDTDSFSSPPSNIPTDSTMEPLSICLYCGKKDRSVEFILPDHYCSQSCADKHGRSGKKATNTIARKLPGKRKKRQYTPPGVGKGMQGMAGTLDQGSLPNRSQFDWTLFLSQEKLEVASDKLFTRESVLGATNKFTVGMKMEGIDPVHPSLYCVLSIAEVKGYRLRLHFDGYSECHDFWTNANSDQIFPVGWCKEMGKQLQGPKGMSNDEFIWESYLHTSNVAAPYTLFTVCSKEFLAKKPAFQIGDKLEAVDVKNKNTYICVATVADTYGDKILVHFDGWEDNYDYWCYYNSAHIHHVGWCQESLKTLSAPNEYEDPSHFTWESYLEETNSRAAPLDAFEPVADHEFKAKMVLEAVDKRNPSLIRVAEILKVTETRLRIHFCGWHSKYDYWEDADSSDLHPVGWCAKTGHPLQHPLTSLDLLNYLGTCPTLGCYGFGHVKGAKFCSHYRLAGCPYADMNMNKNGIIPDRLISKRSPASNRSHPLAEVNNNLDDKTDKIFKTKHKRKNSSVGSGRVMRPRKRSVDTDVVIKSEAVEPCTTDYVKPSPLMPPPVKQRRQESLQDYIHRSVFLPAIPAKKSNQLPLGWEASIKLLPGISNVPFPLVPTWTAEQVADLLQTTVPTLTYQQRKLIIDEKIDGTAFLLLNQSDITSILKLKLGPAIKIYNGVLVIKKALGQM